jgi:hypothetical protein
VSEDSGAVPVPYVLATSVLIEVARADIRIMLLLQNLDASGRPLILPVLAVTGASI